MNVTQDKENIVEVIDSVLKKRIQQEGPRCSVQSLPLECICCTIRRHDQLSHIGVPRSRHRKAQRRLAFWLGPQSHQALTSASFAVAHRLRYLFAHVHLFEVLCPCSSHKIWIKHLSSPPTELLDFFTAYARLCHQVGGLLIIVCWCNLREYDLSSTSVSCSSLTPSFTLSSTRRFSEGVKHNTRLPFLHMVKFWEMVFSIRRIAGELLVIPRFKAEVSAVLAHVLMHLVDH